MHSLPFCKRLAYTQLRCPNTGLRSYSFAREVQNLLKSFDDSASSTVPPIIPATRQRLTAFLRDVKNSDITTKALTRDYNNLHTHSSIRSLPKETGKLYLARLLQERDVHTATKLLLDYDLNEAVAIAKDALATMSFYEREASLFVLWRGFRKTSQKGLAYQILVESGLTVPQIDALKKLIMVQERVSYANLDELNDIIELSIGLSRCLRMDHTIPRNLDMYTAHQLMKRALDLNAHDVCLALCRQNMHATEALQIYLSSFVVEDKIVRAAIDDILMCSSSTSDRNSQSLSPATWIWLLEHVTTPENIAELAKHVLDDRAVRYALASKSATTVETLHLSMATAKSLPKEYWHSFFYQWVSHVSGHSDTTQLTREIFDLLRGSDEPFLLAMFSRYFDSIHEHTGGHLHTYKYASLEYVLALIDSLPMSLDSELQQNIEKQFYSRPEEQVLQYCLFRKTSFESIKILIEHHLSQLKLENKAEFFRAQAALNAGPASSTSVVEISSSNVDKQLQLYLTVFTALRESSMQDDEAKCNEDDLQELYNAILVILLKLSTTKAAVQFIDTVKHIGYEPPLRLSSLVIRRLLRGRRDLWLILVLYKDSLEVNMDYVTWARSISDCVQDRPVLAMEAMQIMIDKGFTPDARLFHDTMMAISTSEVLNDHAAFRYMQDLYHASRKFMVPRDTIHLASFLNVVLVRRGLAVDTRRIAWLLRLSEHILRDNAAAPVTHNEVVEVLHRWALYLQVNGMDTRARPKRLREIIDSLIEAARLPRNSHSAESTESIEPLAIQ